MVKDIFVSYRKNATILFLLSLKRYFCHPKQSILNKTAKSQPLSFFVLDHSERFDIGTSRAKWFVIDRNTDRQADAWLSDLTS